MAGPVCAAAVALPDNFPASLLADSKKLKTQQREEARRIIVEKASAWGVAWASHAEIDAVNILQASLLAMQRAFNCLLFPAEEEAAQGWPQKLETETPFCRPFPAEIHAENGFLQGLNVIVDGLHIPALPVPCKAVVKADSSVHEVMAASILAKTARDRLMEHYGTLYPQYGYGRHKGYPTAEHRKLVLQFGPSPIQRMTFAVKQ